MMKKENNNHLSKIKNTIEFVFLIVLGIVVTTVISADELCGSVMGIIIHLFFKLAVTSILLFISKSSIISFGIYNVSECIFSVFNFLKISTRSQPLEPWDFSFFGDLGVISTFLDMTWVDFCRIVLLIVLFIAITIIDVYAFEKCCRIPDKKGKVAITCIAIPVLIFLCTAYMRINVKYIEANQKGFANYTHFGRSHDYGAMVNFFLDLGMIGWEKIELPYSEEIMSQIYEHSFEEATGLEEYDNVIVLLLESYYDVNELGMFSFEENPLKNYYKYNGENAKLKLCVDNIAGGTSNIEYQILTMHTVEQYNEGIYPFVHLIKNEIESIPRIFKSNGYETTAIHNYKKNFYNRDEAYRLMGIENFFAEEDLDKSQKNPDGFVSDSEVYNKIVETLKKQEKSFITATTMGGHPPYAKYEFDEYTEWYENENWDKNLTLTVNNYLQKVRNSDELLGNLIEYINDSEENTLIIAYGDHFPMLYDLLEEYCSQSKKSLNLTPEKYPELFELPYVVYSNVQKDIKIKERITPSEMGMYILENVKLENVGPLYNGIYNYFKGNESSENYQLMQYDNIQGEQFWEKYNNK